MNVDGHILHFDSSINGRAILIECGIFFFYNNNYFTTQTQPRRSSNVVFSYQII